MASPFNIFRRNQRVMMVVLTGLSMVAFLFFDVTTMKSGGLPKSLTVALFAAICGGGLWYVGSKRGQGSEWALWGAVLGGVAAFLFVRNTGPEPVILGKGIQVTDNDLRKLAERRFKVNRFVFEAGRVTKSTRPSQGFGGTDDRSMSQFVMGQKEAQRLGISLSDAAVNRYLRDITDDKLSKREFSEILRNLGIGESDLFSYLKQELEVRLALEVQAPPFDSWLDFDFQARRSFYRPMLRATPEEQWQYFCRLNAKESLSLVALPVNAFMTKVEEPADSELKTFFDLAKGNLPGPQGEPGFLQPHRVQLAYLSADFDKFQSQAAPPTDDDITAYYEKNKDTRFRIREIPDGPEADLPADAIDPENVIPAFPAFETPSSEDAPADATPDSESKSEPEATPEKPTNDGEASAAEAGEKSPIRLVSLTTQQEESTETPAEPSSEAKSAAEETNDETPETQPKLPALDAFEDDDFPVDMPSPAGDDKAPVRYRELDDELRETIREDILRDRAFAKMGEAADKAQKLMEELSTEYSGKDEAEQAKLAKKFAETLKEYAVNHGLTYAETALLSEGELQSSTNEKIGAAMLATENPQQFQVMTVVDDQFPRGGQPGPLYFPQRADSRLRTQRFAYWKIQDVPQHAPEFTDPGIKDQVQTAWKFQKARDLANRRGQALLELAKQTPDNLSAALSGQTITGEPGTAGIVIKETPRFSWLTTDMTTPMDPNLGDFMAPRLSFIDGVDQQGEDFMRTVFEELKVGETGLAMNYPRTAVYLVQVRERDAAEPAPDDVEGHQSVDELRNQYLALLGSDRMGFATRAYNLIMTNAFIRLQQEWMKSFDLRYGIEMEGSDPAQPGSGRRPRRGPYR